MAGFSQDQIVITAKQNTLTVAGRTDKDDSASYLYRGIAARTFERQFSLADFVEVTGAALENGLLTIDLERRLPEAMKPRRVEIGRQASSNSAMNSEPPSIWIALTGSGISARTFSRKLAAFLAVAQRKGWATVHLATGS